MLPKQCPDCGALNPPANSRCVGCRRDMIEVEEMGTGPLPDQGYQPPIDSSDATFFMTLTGLLAGAACAMGSDNSTNPEACYRAAVAVMELALRRLLGDKLGRPPTEDEVKQFTLMLRPETLGEAIGRHQRLMTERVPATATVEVIKDAVYLENMIEKLQHLLTYRPRAME